MEIADGEAGINEGSDRRRFRSESAWSQPAESGASILGALQLILAESTFGADEDPDCRTAGKIPLRRLIAIENDDAYVRCEGVMEGGESIQSRQACPSRLLHRLEKNALPPLFLAAGSFLTDLDAIGKQGDDPRYSELGSFLQYQLEFVELDERHGQFEFDGALSDRPLYSRNPDRDVIPIRSRHPPFHARSEAVEQLDLFARTDPQNPGSVMQLFSCQLDFRADGQRRLHIKAISHRPMLMDVRCQMSECEPWSRSRVNSGMLPKSDPEEARAATDI